MREFLLDTGVDKNIREAVASKVEDLDEKYYDMVFDFINSGYKKENDFIEIKI